MDWDTFVTVGGLAIVAVGAYLSYRSWRSQSSGDADSSIDPAYGRILAMSVPEAKREAHRLLASTTPFQTTSDPLNPGDRSRLGQLPADVLSFFSSYSEVVGAGARLARSEIRPFEGDPAFVRIGSDLMNADVIVNKTDGRVFVVDKEGDALGVDDAYHSIWHYVLEVASHSE